MMTADILIGALIALTIVWGYKLIRRITHR